MKLYVINNKIFENEVIDIINSELVNSEMKEICFKIIYSLVSLIRDATNESGNQLESIIGKDNIKAEFCISISDAFHDSLAEDINESKDNVINALHILINLGFISIESRPIEDMVKDVEDIRLMKNKNKSVITIDKKYFKINIKAFSKNKNKFMSNINDIIHESLIAGLDQISATMTLLNSILDTAAHNIFLNDILGVIEIRITDNEEINQTLLTVLKRFVDKEILVECDRHGKVIKSDDMQDFKTIIRL